MRRAGPILGVSFLLGSAWLTIGPAHAQDAPPPSEPAPTEPAPSVPPPSEPAPTEPAPSEPAPSEPAPSEPAPTEPAPSEPAPSEPAHSEPADETKAGDWVPPTQPAADDIASAEPHVPGVVILPADQRGSMRTTEALGAGNVGMSLGGGVAVLLPFYGLEVGVGLNDWLDLVGRFESVIGVFHYPHLGLRAQLPRFGDWRIGLSLLANYSFFGIKTDQVNFTSTFYSSFEVGISGPVTDETDLVLGAGGEVDFFKVEVEDDVDRVDEAFAYDATIVRAGLVSAFSRDFHGYAQLKVRIPTETFVFEAQELYVIPMLEIGGTWTF